jgi:hypothetical protein
VTVPESADVLALRQRIAGAARTGSVSLYSFDEGMVVTLGGEIIDSNYFLQVAGIDAPPGLPGIPITFANPEDVMEKYRQPVVVVRRDDISPAQWRLHPGMLQYRAPTEGAVPAELFGKKGFERYDEMQQAEPYDFAYTLSILARVRGVAGGQRNQANKILDHVMRRFPPYGKVFVTDSIGDVRTYEAYQDGVAILDQVADIADRTIGYAVSVRVEGELDLKDAATQRVVTQAPVIRPHRY